MGRRALVFMVIFVGLAAWWLHSPVPKNFSKPWSLRIQQGFFELLFIGIDVADALGVAPWYTLFRDAVGALVADHGIPPDIEATFRLFDGVRVKVYRPQSASNDSRLPGLIFTPGGGWIMRHDKFYDRQLCTLTRQLNMVVVYVEYRLAQDQPFPAAFRDSLIATKYVLDHGAELGVDPSNVGIAGDSAGGNLATAVCLRLRDEGHPQRLRFQVILYPALQAIDFQLPSYQQNSPGRWFRRAAAMMAGMWSLYLTGNDSLTYSMLHNLHTSPDDKVSLGQSYLSHNRIPPQHRYAPYRAPDTDFGNSTLWASIKYTMINPYFAPLLAPDLSGLPKTMMYTVESDVLRDDGILYALRLAEAGNDVTHIHKENGLHGVLNMEDVYEEGQELLDLVVTYMGQNFK